MTEPDRDTRTPQELEEVRRRLRAKRSWFWHNATKSFPALCEEVANTPAPDLARRLHDMSDDLATAKNAQYHLERLLHDVIDERDELERQLMGRIAETTRLQEELHGVRANEKNLADRCITLTKQVNDLQVRVDRQAAKPKDSAPRKVGKKR